PKESSRGHQLRAAPFHYPNTDNLCPESPHRPPWHPELENEMTMVAVILNKYILIGLSEYHQKFYLRHPSFNLLLFNFARSWRNTCAFGPAYILKCQRRSHSFFGR